MKRVRQFPNSARRQAHAWANAWWVRVVVCLWERCPDSSPLGTLIQRAPRKVLMMNRSQSEERGEPLELPSVPSELGTHVVTSGVALIRRMDTVLGVLVVFLIFRD